jgi:glycosyltransferase involved in cell wall biosynthesis
VTQEMALAFPEARVVGILGRPAVARRMGKALPRHAAAPVDCELFRLASGNGHNGYVLLCERLIKPYKKMGVAIDALRRLGQRTVVAGDGPAIAEGRARAAPNVTFVGHLRRRGHHPPNAGAAFFLFLSWNDFGLILVEAMACGARCSPTMPGGAKYRVVPGMTGELFPELTADCIAHALEAFEPDRYDPATIRRHTERWDRHVFREGRREAVRQALT